jgi:hypothetical protein
MATAERTQQISLPALSFKKRTRAYVKIVGKLHKSERADREDDGREPATIVKVVDLEDGLKYRMICPSVLVGILTDDEVDYVGKCFEINVAAEPVAGKRYKMVDLWEIKCPLMDELIDPPTPVTP